MMALTQVTEHLVADRDPLLSTSISCCLVPTTVM
jgi:hypothetical protein